jgi:prephenate dehydrogenase
MDQSLGIIGIGAFGEFMLRHVSPHFRTFIYDAHRPLQDIARQYKTTAADLPAIAACDVIILATPLSQFKEIAGIIAPHLKTGQLVMDVASVKMIPTALLREALPGFVDVVGLHPLFGPQSGRNGISGFNIAVCEVRGGRSEKVAQFLKEKLALNAILTTPEKHDEEAAYVQGLTHMIGKVFVGMDLPPMQQTTKTFSLLSEMVELIRYDSDELFRTIEKENPFMEKTKQRFFDAVQALEDRLAKP